MKGLEKIPLGLPRYLNSIIFSFSKGACSFKIVYFRTGQLKIYICNSLLVSKKQVAQK
jgi:hypothetical protein